MAKSLKLKTDEEKINKSKKFIKNINSNMHYKSELSGGVLTFDWLDEIEFACIYIDNAVRMPKRVLHGEEDIVILEKAKKVGVASVKHLAKHTSFIDDQDNATGDVHPSKLLIVRNEETFNIYENRFIYTLILNITKFVMKKEKELENLVINNEKVLEFASSTNTGVEKVNIEMKITTKEVPKGINNKKLEEEIKVAKKRIARVKQFIGTWQKSELITTLEKSNITLVTPPIKKTNIILKNPNFQFMNKLWDFLQTYEESEENSKDNLDTEGNEVLKSLLNDTFLTNYFILDSISTSKKEQKEKLSKYATIMIHHQIQRVISILMDAGIKISDEEILEMITNEIKKSKTKVVVDTTDVRKKFKNALDEYLEKTQNYL